MPFTILQAGTSIQMLDKNYDFVSLTLPTNIQVDSSLPPRFAVFNRYVVMVNSVSRPIIIDPEGNVYVLTPRKPGNLITLAGAAGGTLSGTFRVKATFVIKDIDGNVITESAFGPQSAAATISGQYLLATNVSVSPDTSSMLVGGLRRLYRTTTNGSVFFPWIDVDGNTVTSVQDDLSDASLSLVAAPTLGSPPDLYLIAEFKRRLFGVGRNDKDTLFHSEASRMYAWPETNSFPIQPVGEDDRGVTALIRRRDELGVARRSAFHKIVPSGSGFGLLTVTEGSGVESQESVVIIKDVAYYLGHAKGQFGIYKWDSGGVVNISDRAVQSWLNSDTYFDRGEFKNAFARYNPGTNAYELHLKDKETGDDRWISFDIDRQLFFGPHKTEAFIPRCTGLIVDSTDVTRPAMGGTNGFIYQMNQPTYEDEGFPIEFDVETMAHHGNAPEIDHYWGELSVLTRQEIAPNAGSLIVTPSTGEIGAEVVNGLVTGKTTVVNLQEGDPMEADLTQSRHRLDRVGIGKVAKFRFYLKDIGKGVRIFGYELPFHELGRR